MKFGRAADVCVVMRETELCVYTSITPAGQLATPPPPPRGAFWSALLNMWWINIAYGADF